MEIQVTKKDAEMLGNLLAGLKSAKFNVDGREIINLFYAIDAVYGLRERIIKAGEGDLKPSSPDQNIKLKTPEKKKRKRKLKEDSKEIKEEVNGNND